MWSLEIQPHVVYLGEAGVEPKLLTIAPTRSSGGGVGEGEVWLRTGDQLSSPAQTLIFYWSDGPHSRLLHFLASKWDLAHMLDILSSNRRVNGSGHTQQEAS